MWVARGRGAFGGVRTSVSERSATNTYSFLCIVYCLFYLSFMCVCVCVCVCVCFFRGLQGVRELESLCVCLT